MLWACPYIGYGPNSKLFDLEKSVVKPFLRKKCANNNKILDSVTQKAYLRCYSK